MTDDQHFLKIYIFDSQTVYACNICVEGFDHMEEIKEHRVISHTDIVCFVTPKKSNTNVVHESEEGLGHKCSDISEVCVTVEWTKEMKYSLLREIDELCNSSEGLDTDGESM